MLFCVGQPVTVIQKPSSRPGIFRFELNRSLTGMGHEYYESPPADVYVRPPDVLARRLFEKFEIDSIHVHSNIVTLELSKGAFGSGIKEFIEELFIYYGAETEQAETEQAAPQESAG